MIDLLCNRTLQRWLTRLAGSLARSRNPFLKNILIRYYFFLYANKVDMHESIEPNPYAYESFNAFFTRRLRTESRPIENDMNQLTSPVDAIIGAFGKIDHGTLIQAKGQYYTIDALLNDDGAFRQGHYITLYLAPYHYHRIHAPTALAIKRMSYIPGELFSVGPKTVATVPQLFARNERVVVRFDAASGTMAMALIGAMIVGSIGVIWEGIVTPNRGGAIRSWDYTHPTNPGTQLQQGDPLGWFEMGSTVVLIIPEIPLTWGQGLQVGRSIKMGEKMAQMNSIHDQQSTS